MKKNNVNQKKGAAHAGIGKIVLWIVLLLVAVIQIFPLIWRAAQKCLRTDF